MLGPPMEHHICWLRNKISFLYAIRISSQSLCILVFSRSFLNHTLLTSLRRWNSWLLLTSLRRYPSHSFTLSLSCSLTLRFFFFTSFRELSLLPFCRAFFFVLSYPFSLFWLRHLLDNSVLRDIIGEYALHSLWCWVAYPCYLLWPLKASSTTISLLVTRCSILGVKVATKNLLNGFQTCLQNDSFDYLFG